MIDQVNDKEPPLMAYLVQPSALHVFFLYLVVVDVVEVGIIVEECLSEV